MFEDKNDEVVAVNSLITSLIDSVNGYRDAAANVEGNSFKELFSSMADERSAVVEDLQAEVAESGGALQDEGSLIGKTHQRFLDLKAAITGRDDRAIINEVERGEEYLKEKFEAAISAEDMGPELRAAVERAWDSVREGHDNISALKHSLTD